MQRPGPTAEWVAIDCDLDQVHACSLQAYAVGSLKGFRPLKGHCFRALCSHLNLMPLQVSHLHRVR